MSLRTSLIAGGALTAAAKSSARLLRPAEIDPNLGTVKITIGWPDMDVTTATANITALETLTTLTDPKINGDTYSGTWAAINARMGDEEDRMGYVLIDLVKLQNVDTITAAQLAALPYNWRFVQEYELPNEEINGSSRTDNTRFVELTWPNLKAGSAAEARLCNYDDELAPATLATQFADFPDTGYAWDFKSRQYRDEGAIATFTVVLQQKAWSTDTANPVVTVVDGRGTVRRMWHRRNETTKDALILSGTTPGAAVNDFTYDYDNDDNAETLTHRSVSVTDHHDGSYTVTQTGEDTGGSAWALWSGSLYTSQVVDTQFSRHTNPSTGAETDYKRTITWDRSVRTFITQSAAESFIDGGERRYSGVTMRGPNKWYAVKLVLAAGGIGAWVAV